MVRTQLAISYHRKFEIDPNFTKPDTNWNGEQVQLNKWLSGKIKSGFSVASQGSGILEPTAEDPWRNCAAWLSNAIKQ